MTGKASKRGAKKRAGANPPVQMREFEWNPPVYPDLTTEEARAGEDALLERVRSDESQPGDVVHFHPAIINRFCDFALDGREIEHWMLEALADSLLGVLKGGEWHDEFDLPGRAPQPGSTGWHPRDEKEFNIALTVAARVMRKERVTSAMHAVAAEMSCSFETVRAAYYKWRPIIAPKRSTRNADGSISGRKFRMTSRKP
ncbi:hypothetical protein E2F46_06135 [Luteimonas aestuarii]|uniref:Uncharacterized protein n=1 Tax=Luteimonas aestuarii TaxID=453837 RepID=A0A4R5TYA7_9GAMM|nr:hypothetical protein [Luteimonas aestuarii]TDK26173.1 hypothetical protein E2F46_06135 [Luteimonas aestuarii]